MSAADAVEQPDRKTERSIDNDKGKFKSKLCDMLCRKLSTSLSPQQKPHWNAQTLKNKSQREPKDYE